MVFIFVGNETGKKKQLKSLNPFTLNLLIIFKSNSTNIKIISYLIHSKQTSITNTLPLFIKLIYKIL